jgi:hypothetical protein
MVLYVIVLYLLLNRVGRKRSYLIVVFCFAILILLEIPVQNYILKNSEGKLTFIINRMINVYLHRAQDIDFSNEYNITVPYIW